MELHYFSCVNSRCYFLTDPLKESNKISRQAFKGEVFELGRRYALVSPKTTAEYLMPIHTEREIKGVPMRGYVPMDTVRIKVPGGGERYVHGGVSLQEIVVLVIVYKGMRTGNKNYMEVKNPGLLLISENRRISNLMFWLDFMQEEAIGEKVHPCTYTLYFTDEAGLPVSDRQTVIADNTSVSASERVIRVRFTLKSQAFNRRKAYRLVISNNTNIPEEEAFTINIALADNFGFD